MGKKRVYHILSLFLLVIISLDLSISYSASSFEYSSQVVIDSGGGDASSDNYKTETSLSQTAVGEASSSEYSASLGFFHTTESTTSNTIPYGMEIDLNPDIPWESDDLYCNVTTNATDPDGDWVNYTYIWYKDGEFNMTSLYKGAIYDILKSGNTSRGEEWNCTVVPYDGTQNGTALSDKVIINRAPLRVNLSYPNNNSMIFNRTPKFNWTETNDLESDTVSYQLLIYREKCGYVDECVTDKINITGITDNYYVITDILDIDSVYNWSVRANDSGGYGEWSGSFNFTIASLNSISIIQNNVDFGTKNLNDIDNTTDDSPGPLLVQNDGNIFVNITVYSNKSLWQSSLAKLNTSYLKFKADNSTEEKSFNYSGSQKNWTNMTSYPVNVIRQLNYSDNTDLGEIELLIRVPPDEMGGKKNTYIMVQSEKS